MVSEMTGYMVLREVLPVQCVLNEACFIPKKILPRLTGTAAFTSIAASRRTPYAPLKRLRQPDHFPHIPLLVLSRAGVGRKRV